MKRNTIFGSILCAALTVGLGAQSGTSSAPSSNSNAKSDDVITVTGCLQAADKSSTGAADASNTSAAAKADNFILANPMRGAASASQPSSAATATGTTGGSTSTEVGPYRLSGGNKDELRRYVNSRVEVTGKIDKAPGAGTANNGESSDAGTTGSAMSTGSRAPNTKIAGRTFRVDSVRQISPSCSM